MSCVLLLAALEGRLLVLVLVAEPPLTAAAAALAAEALIMGLALELVLVLPPPPPPATSIEFAFRPVVELAFVIFISAVLLLTPRTLLVITLDAVTVEVITPSCCGRSGRVGVVVLVLVVD